MLDINSFKSQITQYDVERPNLFTTELSMPRDFPPELAQYMSAISDPLKLFAQNVSLPGVQLSTVPTKRYGLGPNQLMPTGVEFGNTTNVTYIADAGARLYTLFYAWVGLVIPFFDERPAAGLKTVLTIDGQEEEVRNPTFVLSYQSSYVSALKITTYRGAPNKYGGSDLLGVATTALTSAAGLPFIGSFIGGLSGPKYNLEPIRQITLNKAFPIAIGPMNLSSSSGDSYSTFDVTFAYYNWTQKVIGKTAKADESSGGFF
jgi:hypothetical protein